MDSPPTQAPPRLLDICPACGYSLAGSPDEGICPECGRAYDQRVAVIYGNTSASDEWRGMLIVSAVFAVLLAIGPRGRFWPIWGGLCIVAMWCSNWLMRNAHRPTMFTSTHRVVAGELGLFRETVPGSAMMNLLAGIAAVISFAFLACAQGNVGTLIGWVVIAIVVNWRAIRSWRRRRRRQRELGRELTLFERIALEGTPATNVGAIQLTRDKRGRLWLRVMDIRKGKRINVEFPIVYLEPASPDDRLNYIVERMHHWYGVPQESSAQANAGTLTTETAPSSPAPAPSNASASLELKANSDEIKLNIKD